MTGNIWIDLQLSLAEIEALANPFRAQRTRRAPHFRDTRPTDELPAYLSWVMQWVDQGLGARSTTYSTACAKITQTATIS